MVLSFQALCQWCLLALGIVGFFLRLDFQQLFFQSLDARFLVYREMRLVLYVERDSFEINTIYTEINWECLE